MALVGIVLSMYPSSSLATDDYEPYPQIVPGNAFAGLAYHLRRLEQPPREHFCAPQGPLVHPPKGGDNFVAKYLLYGREDWGSREVDIKRSTALSERRLSPASVITEEATKTAREGQTPPGADSAMFIVINIGPVPS